MFRFKVRKSKGWSAFTRIYLCTKVFANSKHVEGHNFLVARCQHRLFSTLDGESCSRIDFSREPGGRIIEICFGKDSVSLIFTGLLKRLEEFQASVLLV